MDLSDLAPSSHPPDTTARRTPLPWDAGPPRTITRRRCGSGGTATRVSCPPRSVVTLSERTVTFFQTHPNVLAVVPPTAGVLHQLHDLQAAKKKADEEGADSEKEKLLSIERGTHKDLDTFTDVRP